MQKMIYANEKIAVGNLKIQAQIYFDKSIKKISKDGVDLLKTFYKI